MIERLVGGWKGKIGVLVLIGFAATDFVITKTLSAADAAAHGQIVWEPWSPEAVAKLRAEGRTVYVDFTARWCATCQTNKKIVFTSDEVRRYFAENRVAALRADWTNKDPRITAELARFQRSAVPFNLIYAPGKPDPVQLPELLTPGKVLAGFGMAEHGLK